MFTRWLSAALQAVLATTSNSYSSSSPQPLTAAPHSSKLAAMPDITTGDSMDASVPHWSDNADALSMIRSDTLKAIAGKAGSDLSISGKLSKGSAREPSSPAGPLEQSDETPSPKSSEAEAAEFAQLCNEGWAWSWSNLKVKIYRYTILVIKQVYLIFMTLSLPTNHLMVSHFCAGVCLFVYKKLDRPSTGLQDYSRMLVRHA
jgi:hypothetical protein